MGNQKEIIFGIRAVTEAIQSGQELERIFFRKDLRGELSSDLLNLSRNEGIPFQIVPVEKLNQFTRKNHQGVVALISPILYHDLEKHIPMLFESGKTPLLLVLDGITDVRNFGAIARTAECAGVDGLIIPLKGSARIHEDAVKTSAGALLTIPVCRHHNLFEAVKYIKNSGIRVVGATAKADLTFYEADLRDPVAIVMGSEEKGISGTVLKICDELVSIPLFGNISSLNVSVAASLLMYEAIRQRTRT
ncbi:MAG: 23S rRNA (guanosine(2251)-2'-O)-methyltransferase RlmB [Bacteroidales bacterium]|nr:23S rRNA (guanosine(2251)-2'-O)-methyltransferase RlmB [Bacteroidales bacterium]